MKVRNDFVTNSSSSSFIIEKKDLTQQQLNIMFDLDVAENTAKTLGMNEYDSPGSWRIEELEDGRIIGSTSMDNFNYIKFLNLIGVDMSKV